MRPRTLRTKVYHTILCAYIADAKRRGFTNAHIWACPPLRTAEYILHKHPRSQRTPGWERLRKWYDEMIRKAHAEGSVVEVGTMYKDHFSLPEESRDRAGVPAPYFPKHHWIEQLELAVHTQRNPISMGPVSRRLRSGSNNSNEMTTSPKKKRRSSSSSSKNKSSLTKKRKTIEKIAISSSSSNNKMFRKRLQGPPNQLSREFARRLTPMAERLLVLRLQPMCTACSQYVQFGETAYRCTGSCCSSSSSYDDDDDVTSQKRRKTSVIKQSDLWTGGSTSSPVISAKNLIHSSAYFCERCCCNVIEKNKKHFDIRRYGHKGPLKPLKIVSSNSSSCLIDDDDDEKEEYTISNPIVDDRLTFLAFCTGNHLQFDTLRHAKYSSILLLHMLFQNREDTIRTFVRYCNVCRIPIAKGERWHCDQCLSFDLCSNCVNKHQTTNNKHLALHEHPLRRVKVGNTPFQAHMNVLS